ncbi:hypothetical protein JX266_013868 [Neoarthrinium moseri]|nr:hypothetical protein JX266_013868 [Neoarthrinium moseri]
MPTLLQLPNEILALVAQELNHPSLLSFRFCSKLANSATLAIFSKRSFTTRYVMLSQYSLDSLLQIARHPTLRLAVKDVCICIDHLLEFPEIDSTTRYCLELDEYETSSRYVFVNQPAYQSLLQDQRMLMTGGWCTAYLAQILSLLPALESVHIENSHRPWGARTIQQRVGIWPNNVMERDDSKSFVREVLSATLSAITASQNTVERLCISAGWDDMAVNSNILVFSQPSGLYISESLQQIRSLDVTLSPEMNLLVNFHWVDDLCGFVSSFLGLEELNLEFSPRLRRGQLRHLQGRLKLENLHTLRLDCVDTDSEELINFLSGFADTIRHLGLSCVEILGTAQDWRLVVHKLHELVPLKSLMLDTCLTERHEVYMPEETEHGVDYLSRFSVTGSHDEVASQINKLMLAQIRDDVFIPFDE